MLHWESPSQHMSWCSVTAWCPLQRGGLVCHRLWSQWPDHLVGNEVCPGIIGMTWANTRTNTGPLSCSPWAQDVPVPRESARSPAVCCLPQKHKQLFCWKLCPLSLREPKFPAWGRHQSQERMLPPKTTMACNRAPVTPAGCGWGVCGHAQGRAGSSPCSGVLCPPPPHHCRDSPPGGGITRGNCWHRRNC